MRTQACSAVECFTYRASNGGPDPPLKRAKMVSWKDLGDGLGAVPRVALRLDYWLPVLRRLLFSQVFLGYALAAGLLFFMGSQFLADARQPGMLGVLMMGLMLGPSLLMVAASLLVPYGLWAFSPSVGRVLRAQGELRAAQVEEPPPFLHYLLWAVPLVVLSVLSGALLWLPVLHRGMLGDAFTYASIAVLTLALMKLYARAALAAHYAREDIDLFLATTRWQRLLAWAPLSLAVAWGLAESFELLAKALALPVPWFLGPSPAFLALLAGHALAAILVGIAYVATLLFACERMATPPEEPLTSVTLVLPPRLAPRPRPRIVARPAMSWRGRVAITLAVLAVVPAAAWLARAPLVDWYLDGRGTQYSIAVDVVNRHFRSQGAALDAGRREDRLVAGYVLENCMGHREPARWLGYVVQPTPQHQDWMLTCAACNGPRGTVQRLLVDMPALPHLASALPTHGDGKRPRTALACAVAANDMGLAHQLLPAQTRGIAVRGQYSALQAAIERRYWPMARMLVHTAGDRQELQRSVLMALEQARVRRGATPAELVPGLRLAGLPLEVADSQGRNLFHYAAMWHDLPLARALLEQNLPAPYGPTQPDAEGELPWRYVLRKAEQDGKPLNDEGIELLRLLLPETLTIGP